MCDNSMLGGRFIKHICVICGRKGRITVGVESAWGALGGESVWGALLGLSKCRYFSKYLVESFLQLFHYTIEPQRYLCLTPWECWGSLAQALGCRIAQNCNRQSPDLDRW